MEGKTQQTAAAVAGMRERSARKWQCGPLPSETKTERRWRTGPDPFDGVWEDLVQETAPAPGRYTAPAPGRGRRQAQGNDNHRVAGGAASRPLQRLPAPHSATAITGLADPQRPGPGGLLPPGASPGARGPDRLHPLQLPGSEKLRRPLRRRDDQTPQCLPQKHGAEGTAAEAADVGEVYAREAYP